MTRPAPDSTRLRLRDFCIVAAVYMAAFLVIAGFPHVLMGFPLDDSWIHQVVARNFARYGTLGFIPGVWSSGSSSLLWTLVLAINWKFLPAVNPVVYSGALNAAFLITIGLGLLAMARKDGLPRSTCWIWALTPALNGNFIWLGVLGMEHVLFAMLSVLGVYLWFQTGRRSAILCALCLGALSLTRPEGLVLTGLAVLASRWAHRGRRDVLILVSTVAVCVMVFLTVNFLTSHSWLPMTYAGRKWLYFGSLSVPNSARFWFTIGLTIDVLKSWLLSEKAGIFFFPLVATCIVIGLRGVIQKRPPRITFLCLWSFALIGTYFVMLPSGSHADRYLPLYLGLNFPLMFMGAEICLRRLSLGSRPAIVHAVTLVAVCLFCGFFSLKVWSQATRDGITVVESSHARMGKFISNSLPPDAKVAAFDIGRIGFIYGGHLIDLGGLTDSSFLPYMQQHRIVDYLAKQDTRYFVWPSNPDGSSYITGILVFTPEIQREITPLAGFCAPTNVWTIARRATGAFSQCQFLYRLNAPGAEPAKFEDSEPTAKSSVHTRAATTPAHSPNPILLAPSRSQYPRNVTSSPSYLYRSTRRRTCDKKRHGCITARRERKIPAWGPFTWKQKSDSLYHIAE